MSSKPLKEYGLLVHDFITLAIQLAIDEVKDAYDRLKQV